MDQEKAYIEVTEFLCTELKRIKSEKDLYKGMWEQAEEELRKLEAERGGLDPDADPGAEEAADLS